MLYMVVVMIVVLGIIGILCAASNSAAQKRLDEWSFRFNTLQPIMDRLFAEKEKEYNEIICNEEYSQDSADVKKARAVSVWQGDLNKYSPEGIVEFWCNHKNLCIVTSLDSIMEFLKMVQSNNASSPHTSLVEDDYKKLLQRDDRAKIYKTYIPVDSIEYFYTEGDIYTTVNISGGGGTIGGSSLKGAVVGGIVGGGTGAVIGSRKETVIRDIESTTQVHDEKYTIIKYRNAEGILKEVKIKKGHEAAYNILKELFPEKEYAYLLQKKSTMKDSNSTENDVSAKMKQLKELYEKELIIKEEYDKKKQEILDTI